MIIYCIQIVSYLLNYLRVSPIAHWNHLHLPGAVFREENYHKYTIMSSIYIHFKQVLCH